MRRSTRAYAVLAAADVALAGASRSVPRRVTKPLLMPLLMAGRDGRTRAALALSGVGDIALLGSGPRAFELGLGAFLGGHLAWIAALTARRNAAGRRGVLRRRPVVAVPYLAAATLLTAYVAPRAGRDRAAVVAYAAVLTEMTLAAVDSGDARVATGGTVFMASDALLALDRFAGVRLPAHDGWVMATYTLAQALLATERELPHVPREWSRATSRWADIAARGGHTLASRCGTRRVGRHTPGRAGADRLRAWTSTRREPCGTSSRPCTPSRTSRPSLDTPLRTSA